VQVSLVINPLSGVQGITADGVRQFAAHTLNSTSGRHFSKSSGLSESSDQRTPVVQYRTKPEPPTDFRVDAFDPFPIPQLVKDDDLVFPELIDMRVVCHR
jgi:hypothetical protein